MSDLTFATKDLQIETASVVSTLRRRDAAVSALQRFLDDHQATAISGTADARRNRDRGRFARGWTVTVRAIVGGRDYGLGESMALETPRQSLRVYLGERWLP